MNTPEPGDSSLVSPREPDVEVEDADETDAVPRHVAPITYFGTEFDVHGLVRRFNQKAIVVPSFDPSGALPDPMAQGFQRGRVWRPAQMQRFIESLLLGFPVPGIFLVEQPGKKYLVLDGQQRLTTLASFYADKFSLDNLPVEDALSGAVYSKLHEDAQRALDDTFIQAIIIRTPSSVNEYESVYQIFERLNSGGTNLQPHEIRVALYGGRTVDAIRDLNNNSHWRQIFGKRHARLKDQELILRVLALSVDSASYSAPLKSFLNDFLYSHRDGQGLDLERMGGEFLSAAEVLATSVGDRPFRLGTQVNAAILESVFVAVMQRFEAGFAERVTPEAWKAAYESLLADGDYRTAVSKATANEDSVARRLKIAREAFSNL